MSLIDLLKNKGKSTAEIMGVESIEENYVKTKFENLFYYAIQPTNVSVLSEDALYLKINALMTVLRGQSEVELFCSNSRENFDANKEYIGQCMKEETTPQVLRMLQQEMHYYDKIQIQTVTARQFFLIIRYRGEIKKETSSYLSQVERLIRQHGFSIKQADKNKLKQLLSVYWSQNVTTEYFENYDGERWVIMGDK